MIPTAGMATAAFVVLLALIGEGLAEDRTDIEVRIQPRLDFGDYATAAGTEYRTQLDVYIRRSRLELIGRPTDDLYYVLAVSGDRAGQRGTPGGAEVAYAFVNYRLAPSAELRAGLVKLPFSRGGWVSSSRALLIERAQTVSTAAAALGDYITPHLALHGRLRTGTIGYSAAVMDGLQPGDVDSGFSRARVSASDRPGLVVRVEISPEGWVEEGESESHLGAGRHLTLGLNGAVQSGIQFEALTEDRRVLGGDLSFHLGGFSLQSEYLRVDRDGSADLAPAGWYVQTGIYLADLRVEPAARLERYDAALPGGSDVTATYSGGLNWYRQGHDHKLMANVIHTRFQREVRPVDAARSRTQLQLQSQVYF